MLGRTGLPSNRLALVEALAGEPALKRHHLLPGARGNLLATLGRHREAAEAFESPLGLTQNARERALMQERAAEGARGGSVTRRSAAPAQAALSASLPSGAAMPRPTSA